MAEPRRPRAATIEKRQRILDATEELMLTQGYAAVSSRSVAAAVGIQARIQMTDPRMQASSRYAERRALSIKAPDRIEAVVQEKRRNAAQKTPEIWSVRLGARFADHG